MTIGDNLLIYYRSQVLQEIRTYFCSFMQTNNINDFHLSTGRSLRTKFIDFLADPTTRKMCASLTREIALAHGIPASTLVIQRQATPRIFRPGDHGTSVHTDYWYGHGTSYFTVWVPLTPVQEGNAFWAIRDEHNSTLISECTKDFSLTLTDSILKTYGYPVLPPEDSVVVFSSQLLHGSPLNYSGATRLSFDFRFGAESDITTTKDPANFAHLLTEVGTRKLKSIDLENTRFIKYIVGGQGLSTLAQHVLIEGLAKVRGFRIAAQEAEVERFGRPVISEYLSGHLEKKGLGGILVASESLLPAGIRKEAYLTSIPVFFALENFGNWELDHPHGGGVFRP